MNIHYRATTLRHAAQALVAATLLVAQPSCRDVDYIVPTIEEETEDTAGVVANVCGLYLLNEGNMGSNKSSLDYLDFASGTYFRNIYAERNPNVVKELGDVGNDIQIYGSRLYLVINCSNKVEVLDARTGVRIGQVNIPNCRYIRFADGKAYVSSYVGPVSLNKGDAVKGAVYQVDTASLQIEATCSVGYQPDELEVMDDGYIYVANSGGYMVPDYERTVSVIDRATMTEVRRIDVGINLHRLKKDSHGRLWVSSRGNYEDVASNLYTLERGADGQMRPADTMNIACSNMTIRGDSLYLYSVEWSNHEQRNTVTYGIIDTRTKRIVSRNFITDGTEADIEIPYGIAVHPVSGDIYVTDAKNYVSSGWLICYDRHGKRKWRVRTGDIPAHMAFLRTRASFDITPPTPPQDTTTTPPDTPADTASADATLRSPRLQKALVDAGCAARAYLWERELADGTYEEVSRGRTCIVVPSATGEVTRLRLSLTALDGRQQVKTFAVVGTGEAGAYSHTTAICYEYRPAPGQFVNMLPRHDEGDTEADMAAKAGECMADDEIITLGAYGGYVTFGFDHTVANRHGQKDFRINGNAFYSDRPEYGAKLGGSCEPGIVMVSLDVNMNGLPDDPWYELAGSAYSHPDSCLHGYKITYHRPTDHTPEPDKQAYVTDAKYIRWTDNQGGEGYVRKNSYHTQDYYPAWITEDEMSFSGSKLLSTAVDESGVGRYYVLYSFGWGYVDNHPNTKKDLCSFDIDWAVDSDGNSVSLPGVDFIRVYTGQNQDCGWLGETSTEVGAAFDLSLTD